MKDKPTDSSRNTWESEAALTWCERAAQLQPRVSQELGKSMLLGCVVSGHMHPSLEETWAGKRDLGSPLHNIGV